MSADTLGPEKAVTRIEVIDETGRIFTRWNTNIELSYQDEGRTLKVFVAPASAEVVSPQEERLLVTQKFLDAMNATCREFAEVDEALGTPMDGTDEEAQAYRLATIAKLKSAEVVSPPKKSYVVHCGYDSAGILQRVADELPCRLTVREVVALRELLGNAPTAEVVSQPPQEELVTLILDALEIGVCDIPQPLRLRMWDAIKSKVLAASSTSTKP